MAVALKELQQEYQRVQPFLKLDFEELAGRGILEYVRREFLNREQEKFRIGKKYGMQTIDELDAALAAGRLKEDDIADDDYIELTELEKETQTLKRLMQRFA